MPTSASAETLNCNRELQVASSPAHKQRFSQAYLGAGGWQRVDESAVEPQARRPEVQGPDIRHAASLHQQLLHGLQLLPDSIPQADHRQAAQGLCPRHVPQYVQQQGRALQLERPTCEKGPGLLSATSVQAPPKILLGACMQA